MPANTRAASRPTAGGLGGLRDPPLTTEEIKIWPKRFRTVRETAICPKCIEGSLDSDQPATKETLSLAPTSSNPLTLSCHVRKKTTRAEKIVKSLIAIAETGNSHSPLAAAGSMTRTLTTCTATEFQDLSATVAALQTELRRSETESNSKVAAVTEELRKVQGENVAPKAAMDEDRAPRNDDELKQQLEKLSRKLEKVRNENAALRTQPRLYQETPSPSTTSVTQLEKIVSDFMAHQTLTQAETSKQIAELGRIVAKLARNNEEPNRAQTTIRAKNRPSHHHHFLSPTMQMCCRRTVRSQRKTSLSHSRVPISMIRS